MILKNLSQELMMAALETAIPQVRGHLSVLLMEQKTAGSYVQMAEDISYGDLFHTHIRMNQKGLDDFRNKQKLANEDFHFQYHGFETAGLYQSQWQQELAQLVSEPEVQEWLFSVQKASGDDPRCDESHYECEDDFTTGKPLSSQQVTEYARLWYQNKYSKLENANENLVSWRLNRLEQKIKRIDPEQINYKDSLTQSRSVVVQRDEYLIIKDSNIKGYSQPLTIYFDKIDRYKGLRSFLLQQDQLKIFKPRGPKSSESKKSLTYDSLMTLLISTEDPLATFSETLKRSYSKKRHMVFTWDEDYIYSVKQDLDCE